MSIIYVEVQILASALKDVMTTHIEIYTVYIYINSMVVSFDIHYFNEW